MYFSRKGDCQERLPKERTPNLAILERAQFSELRKGRNTKNIKTLGTNFFEEKYNFWSAQFFVLASHIAEKIMIFYCYKKSIKIGSLITMPLYYYVCTW